MHQIQRVDQQYTMIRDWPAGLALIEGLNNPKKICFLLDVYTTVVSIILNRQLILSEILRITHFWVFVITSIQWCPCIIIEAQNFPISMNLNQDWYLQLDLEKLF